MCDKRPISIYMPENLIIESRVEAARRNESRSAFVVRAIERAIRESQQQRGQQAGEGQQADKLEA